MSSRKQRNANKHNARNSTGPQTETGKQRSSQNGLKHGVYSLRAVIPGEDPAEFDQLCSEFVDEFQPDTPYERSLVRQIADAEWRLRRISRLEADFLEAAFDTERGSLGDGHLFSSADAASYCPDHDRKKADCHRCNEPDEGLLLGRALQTRTADLVRFARYEADLTRRQRQAHAAWQAHLLRARRQPRRPRRQMEARRQGRQRGVGTVRYRRRPHRDA